MGNFDTDTDLPNFDTDKDFDTDTDLDTGDGGLAQRVAHQCPHQPRW